MRRAAGIAAFVVAAALAARSGEAGDGIEDNSFLIEEAYNQDWGVVQHISSFDRREGDWVASFTQEWPVPSRRHQLSYTVALTDVAGGVGLADGALNYRYQLVDAAAVACSPRLSLLVPTGDARAGRGEGGAGAQLGLPASFILGGKWVAHANVGLTYRPRASDTAGARARTAEVSLGGSLIWRGAPRFNLLVETVWTRGQAVVGAGRTERTDSWVVSPGVRAAFNFRSGLQIVPGIAVPIGVGPSRGADGVFLYLSFEHPFRRRR